MARRFGLALVTAAAMAGGCVPADFLQGGAGESNVAIVPSSTFGVPQTVNVKTVSAKNPQAAPETLILVDRIGRELVAANALVGIQPTFVTIGQAEPEVFHRDTACVFITDSMVKLCKTEGQLAAVLSMEMGKMVSEREALAGPQIRYPEKGLPIVVPMGNAGQFSGLEQLNQQEVATLDCDRRRPSKCYVPPDPAVLARRYLEAAKIDPAELDAVAPILAQAERNYAVERQLSGAPDATAQWRPQQ
jgi:hypothetical protein